MKCNSCQTEMVRKEEVHRITYECTSCKNNIKIESRNYNTTNLVTIIKSQLALISNKRHFYLE